MIGFADIEARAVARHGAAALAAKMPDGLRTPAELAQIPDDRWLAELTRKVFSAGFNWSVIEAKWPGFEAAFGGFDPAPLAAMSPDTFDALLKDTRIVRNAAKINAVQANALFLCDLAQEHGSAARAFADWPGDDFSGLLLMVAKRGSRLGGTTAQYAFRAMGKDGFVLSGDVTGALIAAGVIDGPVTSQKALRAVQAAFNIWAAESGRPLAHISRTLGLSHGDVGPR